MKNYGPARFLALIALILFALLFKQTITYAQIVLGKRISINLKNDSVKAALDKISAAIGVKFTYNDQVKNSKIKITIKAKNETLDDMLSKVLSGHSFKFSALEQDIYIRFEAEKVKKLFTLPMANIRPQPIF